MAHLQIIFSCPLSPFICFISLYLSKVSNYN
nr:MAG TPA: hypothetical protein [Bacteriophage sp.]